MPIAKNSQPIDIEPDVFLNEMFYHQESFDAAVRSVENTKVRDDVRAIVVPHHLVASEYITDLYKMSSGRDIDKVIIIGPNHENIGNRLIGTADLNWETPFGTLESDTNLVDSFASDMGIKQHKDIFTYEHSIGAHAPFVKYYFSQAKILPIVLSSYAERQEVDAISQWLVDNIDDNTLVVVSIDFSHYLDKDAAEKKDELTRQLITDRDINRILELSNTDNVDSPASLATVIKYADLKDLDMDIIHHGNSFDLLETKPIETTSYFAIIFTEK